MKAKCSNCNFWEIKDELNGICHRYAPRPTIAQGKEGSTTFIIVWAMTRKDDWCGDFNPMESFKASDMLSFNRDDIKANA